MKTLINLQHPFLCTPNPTPSNTHHQIPFISLQTAKDPIFNSRKTWRLKAAEPKGFGSREKPKPDNVVKVVEEDEKIPDEVWNRIATRILVYVGAPLVSGLGLLRIIGALKENQIWDAPNWVAILILFVFLGASTLGVAYGALSASWDEDRQGSVLGFDEAKRNWTDMWAQDNSDSSN